MEEPMTEYFSGKSEIPLKCLQAAQLNNNDILSLFEVSDFLITGFFGHTFICIDPIIQGSTQLK